MKITMRRIVDAGTSQGYWSIVTLEHVEEEFVTHPFFGRVRITNCSETETHCGFGKGCFEVTSTRFPSEPMLVRVIQLKQAGWEIV